MKHRRTDPACRFHKVPRGRLAQMRYDRARGRSCPICMGRGERAALRLLGIQVRSNQSDGAA